MHFGIISPPVPGHLHPFGALGRELIGRGHRVSLIHMPDLEERARREGLEYISVGRGSHPAGSLPVALAQLSRYQGLAALRFTIRMIAETTEMMLRDGPRAIGNAGVTALLVDQTEGAGGSIAEYLDLPFVTVCNALALNREPSLPPAFADWSYNDSWFGRARNRLGYAISDRFLKPVTTILNGCRRDWGLRPMATMEETFSPLAQISQQPKLFDYPRSRLPANFHYAGPLRGPLPAPIPFPWERLDGRPLIYASLGTLQNNRLPVFRCFAEACADLDVQLVVTHGGGLTEADVAALPRGPLVVGYAPQLEVLARARLTITHAGLNTVLDSLSCGVPAVAIPITYEQPAIAERLRYTGAGEIVSFGSLNPGRLREAVRKVLAGESFAANARRIAESIRTAGGTKAAADTIVNVTKQK
ncbi:MAG: glycosyltransferase [Terriglobia bacterium]